jgi:hypothetical protein
VQERSYRLGLLSVLRRATNSHLVHYVLFAGGGTQVQYESLQYPIISELVQIQRAVGIIPKYIVMLRKPVEVMDMVSSSKHTN